jgi:NADPH:quinone reductase-like Zn-dependent oxidoreductase
MHGAGGPDVLRVERVPLPGIGDGQVLLRVRAAGVNPVDRKIRERVSAERCAQRGIACPEEAAGAGAGAALEAIRKLAEDGKFRLNVDRAFPLAHAAQAQELNRQGRTRGKIVLRVEE